MERLLFLINIVSVCHFQITVLNKGYVFNNFFKLTFNESCKQNRLLLKAGWS